MAPVGSYVTSSHCDLPLVSCLMLTKDRLRLAERAIRCYQNQLYPHRELVIVCQGDYAYQDELRRLIDQSPIVDVRLIAADPRLPLGALRNVSLEEARGELVCIWDDDDCSHPERLTRQVDRLVETNVDAVFLSGCLHLFEPEGILHWLDMSVQPDRRIPIVPGTMVMRRDSRFRYPEAGQYAHSGEDEQLAVDLYRQAKVDILGDLGWLYLYAYHGNNTFPLEHHVEMRHFSLPSSSIRARSDEIRDALAQYPIAKPIFVHGPEGALFTVDA